MWTLSTRDINGEGIVLSLQPTSNGHDDLLGKKPALKKVMNLCKGVPLVLSGHLPIIIPPYPIHVSCQVCFLHRVIYFDELRGISVISPWYHNCKDEHPWVKDTWALTYTHIIPNHHSFSCLPPVSYLAAGLWRVEKYTGRTSRHIHYFGLFRLGHGFNSEL